MQIASKIQMYSLYEAGAFGNKLRTWPTLKALLASKFAGLLSLRYRGENAAGLGLYDVPSSKVEGVIREQVAAGWDASKIVFNEAAPDSRIVVQGELMRCPYGAGYYLFYSTEKTRMRTALARSGQHMSGPCVLLYLRGILSPASYDDMMELLDLYPDSVIEFSAYAMNLGDCRGRNTIIWEVRNY